VVGADAAARFGFRGMCGGIETADFARRWNRLERDATARRDLLFEGTALVSDLSPSFRDCLESDYKRKVFFLKCLNGVMPI